MKKYLAFAVMGTTVCCAVYDMQRSEAYHTVGGAITSLMLTIAMSAAVVCLAVWLENKVEEYGPFVMFDYLTVMIVMRMLLGRIGYVPGEALGTLSADILAFMPTVFCGILIANFARFLLRIAIMNLVAVTCLAAGNIKDATDK